ncbi:MAG TPA: histidine kinase [Gemmatimonadales bacterium]|nr:histidine kinase [Gemmatimonadales bacterium]
MTHRESWVRTWFGLWGWGFAAYTILGVMGGIQDEISLIREHVAFAWTEVLASNLIGHYGIALFVPPIVLLVRRYPLDRARWKQNLTRVLVATLLLFVVMRFGVEQLEMALFTTRFIRPSSFVSGMYTLWVIVLAAQATEYYRGERERERQAVELRARLTHAQLEALRSQLHPHFLFNTLNAAATLMHTDVPGADRMLTELADLLRATLAFPGTHEIPLAEELALVDRYLSIMRVRFLDRLTVRIDVPPEARDALVPAFLLQPLLENALEHGLAVKPGPGELDVVAAHDDGRLTITITDDGPGPAQNAAAGVGLTNTRERLTQLYGSDQALTLGPAGSTGGGRVRVSIPWRLRPAS